MGEDFLAGSGGFPGSVNALRRGKPAAEKETHKLSTVLK
jgi:hypothetical protein